MKKNLIVVSFFALTLCGARVHAGNKYWDINGATPGSGQGTGAGTWNTTGLLWSTDATGGSATTTFTSADTAVFSAGTDATSAWTINAPSAITATGIMVEEGTVSLAGGTAKVTVGTGAITVNTGAKFSIGSSSGLGASAGSTCNLNGSIMENRNTGSADNFLPSAMTITISGSGGILSYTAAGVLNILQTGVPGNIISGSGGITKIGAGILAVATACTYTGPTIITNGTLRTRSSSNRLPTGTDVTITSPGVFDPAVSQTVKTVNGNGAITFSLSGTLTINGGAGNDSTITGNITDGANFANLTKSGAGILTLGGANTYDGKFTLSAGTCTVNSGATLCGPACDVLVNGGTLNLNNTAQTIENLTGTGGNINLGSGHTLTVLPAASGTYSGTIASSGNLTFNGNVTNILTLSGANTYSGLTTVTSGTLQLGANNAVPGGSAVILANGATFDMNGKNDTIASLSGAGNVINNAGTLTVSGNLSTTSFNAYSGFSGTLNSGSLTKGGTHAMALRGANTFAGTLTFNAGTLSVGAAADRLPPATVLLVPSGALFQLDANSQTVASLSGAGSVNLGGGTLTVNQAGNTTFSGVIQNSELAGSPAAVGHGLRGYYYDNDDFTSLVAVRDDATVNFTNLTLSVNLPTPPYPNTNQISIRWLGQVLTTVAGTYTFTTTSDDGQRLWVNGTLLIDDWASHGATAKSGFISLAANTRYDIVMEYFNGAGGASTVLSWTPPSDSSTVIPTDYLFLPGPGTLVKAGAGTLALSATNTYTGITTVSQGTLDVQSDGGLGRGNVAVADAATLTLELGLTNGYINSAADLLLNGPAPLVNLNFTGTNTIHALSYDGGITYEPIGTYGAIGSGADHENSRFALSGFLKVTAVGSVVALVSSGSPTVYGSSVTFTSTVTGSGATPTGTVTFYDGPSIMGTGTLDGSGVATFVVNNLSVTTSPHSITAVYGGDPNYASSTSSAVSQTTTPATVVPSVTVTATRVYDGTTNTTILTRTLTGVLTGDASYVHLSGGIAGFLDKNVGVGKTVNIAGLTLTGSLSGNYVLSSTTASTTATITTKALTVTGITANNKPYDGTTTATINTGSAVLAGVVAGDDVTLNTGAATGAFADAAIGNAKVVTISGLTISGADATNYSLTQPTTTANITKGSVSVSFGSSPNPSGPGTNVTFTLTLTAVPPTPGPPTGNVLFKTNNVLLGSVALAGGVAATNTSSLPIGTNTVTAEYAGDATFFGSTNSLQQVVKVPVTYSQTNVILSIVDNHDTSLTLNMLGTPQAQYYIVAAPDVAQPMASWVPFPDSTNTVTNVAGLWSYNVTNSAPQQFYRSTAVNPAP